MKKNRHFCKKKEIIINFSLRTIIFQSFSHFHKTFRNILKTRFFEYISQYVSQYETINRDVQIDRNMASVGKELKISGKDTSTCIELCMQNFMDFDWLSRKMENGKLANRRVDKYMQEIDVLVWTRGASSARRSDFSASFDP